MRRRRKTPRAKLVKNLDDVVREILKIREPYCVLCGSKDKLGVSHLFSRRAYTTRWDTAKDGNCHINCWPCNFRHVRDQYPYFNWYIEKFGKDKFDELRQRFNQVRPFKTHELEELYEKLKEQLENARY